MKLRSLDEWLKIISNTTVIKFDGDCENANKTYKALENAGCIIGSWVSQFEAQVDAVEAVLMNIREYEKHGKDKRYNDNKG